MEDFITFRIWHGGSFEVGFPNLSYVGGQSQLIRIEIDKVSFFELVDYVMETGSYQSKDFHMYCLNLGHEGFKRLVSDEDVIDMAMKVSTIPTQILDLYIQKGPISKPSTQSTKEQAQSSTQPNKPEARPTVSDVEESDGSDNEGSDKEVVGSDVDESDSGEEGSAEEGSEDELSDEEVLGSDKDDDEWRESVAAIKKVSREEVVANNNLLQECLKQSVPPLDYLVDKEDAGGSILEAYSSYEDSDGYVNSPGDSEDDDIVGKKYKQEVPIINDQTDWKKFTWDLTGIPCKHVCAVAGFLNRNAEEFVDACYHKENYMKSYEFTIPPMPSERYWPCVDAPLDPPPIKIAPGRPKKNRKRDPHEDPKRPGKLTSHGCKMTCGICGGKGHNKRTCTGKAKDATEPAPKRGRGRPKKTDTPLNTQQLVNNSQQSKGRGRAKQTNLPDNSQQLVESQQPMGRGRGRPRKTKQ